jgi:hypothetical protein
MDGDIVQVVLIGLCVIRVSRNKTFCLRCYKANMACKGKDKSKHFGYSHKLRVPKINNKVKFREFLNDCPIFVNCVSEKLQKDFREMLRYLKMYGVKINGKDWTYVEKGKER